MLDRKKDLIISGGFNVYPSDLKAVLRAHDHVVDCAVVGVPSERWGETPIGFYVARHADAETDAILEWANLRLGRTQRMSALFAVVELPRNAIGKVVKNELRERSRQ